MVHGTFTHIPNAEQNICNYNPLFHILVDRGSTVAKMLCYKSGGRWLDLSRCHLNFSLT